MFFRTKKSGTRSYLQIVENRWEDGRPRQRVIATLGRLDQLQQTGQLDALLALGRAPRPVRPRPLRSRQGTTPDHHHPPHRPRPDLRAALATDRLPAGHRATPGGTPLRVRRRAGHLPHRPPSPLRLRQRPGRRQVEDGLPDRGLRTRSNSTTSTGPWPGSARSCPRTSRRTRRRSHPAASRTGSRRSCSPTAATSSPISNWSSSTPPRSTSRARAARDIGQRGFSKDHRPDLYQMVVGAVLDGQGRPICCELWPGNTTDVTTLDPRRGSLRSRFGIGRVCIVADRGMISQETIAALEQDERGWQYILGCPDAERRTR